MISSSFKFSTTPVKIKRFGRLFLALPFSILLIGCDSSSSTVPAASDNNAQAASVKNAQNTDSEAAALAFRDAHSSADDSDDDEDEGDLDEGQSLIAAAKSDDNAHTRRTQMFSGARNNSTLQATLMGDYGGILPCAFCDNIDITLNLFANGSVAKTSIYNNPELPKLPIVESGIYRQDGNTITVVYENKTIESYRIQNNHLIMIDEDQQPDADYTLSRK